MIKAVIFDLGKVLVDIDFKTGLLGYLNMTSGDSLRRLSADENFLAFSRGEITPQIFYERSKKKYNLELTYSEFVDLWCNIFTEKEGMKELVAKVRATCKVGLLSDTDPLHWNYIKILLPWVTEFFTEPVLSYQVNYMKPHFKMYLAAAESVCCRPEECLFIDDLPQNIQGAEQSGMKGILFTGVDELYSLLRGYIEII